MKNLFHYILAFFSSTLCFIWLCLLPNVFPFFFLCSESPLNPPATVKFLCSSTHPQGHSRMNMGNLKLNFLLHWSEIKSLYIFLSPLQCIQALPWSTICSRPLCRKAAIPNVGGEIASSSILWTSLCCSLLHTLLIFSPLKWTRACEKSGLLLTQSASFLEENEWN